MPSLRDALSTALPNYINTPPRPPVASVLPTYNKQNQYLRCILPPFNADTDTLRQFESGSANPKIRVIPLPPRAVVGSSTTINNNLSVSGGSGSTNTTTNTLLPLSAFITTSLLPAGTTYSGSVSLSQSFQLISVAANYPCEIRLYGTALAQSFDAARPTDTPVPAEVSDNIISCVNLDTPPYTWPFQNRIGANQDSPQGTSLYVTVVNTDPALTEAITVAIVYVPLET
jgi:hypothetical protein